MTARVVALALAVAVLLAGCGVFRPKEEPTLPGERISVLALDDRIVADPGLVGVVVRLPAPYRNDEWPQAGGHATHAMHHLALPQAVSRVWRVSVGVGASRDRRLVATPVVAAGVVFVMDTEASVSAIRATDGTQLWKRQVGPVFEERGAIGGGLAVDSGRLFVSTAYGDLLSLDLGSGATVWTRRIGLPLRGAPTVADGRAFVLSNDNQLHAVAADTGELLWTHSGIQEVAGFVSGVSPAVAGDTVVVPYSSGEVFALRSESGRVVWTESLSRIGRLSALAEISDIVGLPVIDREFVFVVGHVGRMIAVEIRSGIRVWDQDAASIQSPWVAGNFLFSVTINAEVIAVSREDGRVRWVQQLRAFENEANRNRQVQWAGPVLAGDRLLLGSSTGEVVALSPYDGRILGSLQLGAGVSVPPVVAGGTAYFLTDDAALHAFR